MTSFVIIVVVLLFFGLRRLYTLYLVYHFFVNSPFFYIFYALFSLPIKYYVCDTNSVKKIPPENKQKQCSLCKIQLYCISDGRENYDVLIYLIQKGKGTGPNAMIQVNMTNFFGFRIQLIVSLKKSNTKTADLKNLSQNDLG